MHRIVRDLRPRYVLVENVSALLALRDGLFGELVGGLAALGYDAEWDCLPASAFGAPHRRDRVLLTAVADSGRRDAKGAGYPGQLPTEIALLPTPDASVFNYSQSPETMQARKKRELAKGYNGNGGGTPLAMAVRLLPTPTESDARNARNATAPRSRDSKAHSGTTLLDAALLSSGASTSP
jgi:site-specific DNA-cytosine methylase